MLKNLGISVIVDNHPRFFCEYILWVLCANDTLKIPKRVYFINNKHDSLIEFSKKYNIEVKFAGTLIPDTPHCNKIIPFLDKDKFDNQIVTDTDLFFTRDITPFLNCEEVRLPPNNHAAPPYPLFVDIFNKAGISKFAEIGTSLFKGGNGRETFAKNVSAGIIYIPDKHNSFIELWHKNACWLSKNKFLLKNYFNHVDQVSIAMTLHENNIPFSHLPAQTNAILEILPEINSVYAFHLTSGHISIPRFKNFFNSDKTLNIENINTNIKSDCESLNNNILKSIQILQEMNITKDFVNNFLNTNWKRNK